MAPKATLLVVEDEDVPRAKLRSFFEEEGYAVTAEATGERALAALDRARPDLAIIDVALPGIDGREVCRRLRAKYGNGVRVIMISGNKKTEMDKVVGLEVGGDLYLEKPISFPFLLAQVRALLRIRPDRTGWLVVDEHMRIHLEKRLVEIDGRPVRLTEQEFKVLEYLVQHAGKPCSREDLIEAVWGYGEGVSDTAVNGCISDLRKEIEAGGRRYIFSERGVGYRFVALEE